MLGHPDTTSAMGEDGKAYQLETQVFWESKKNGEIRVWESKKNGEIRVMVSADDGGLRSFMPLTGDFIMAPDGSFVGESFGGY